jgi:hypothetical protein
MSTLKYFLLFSSRKWQLHSDFPRFLRVLSNVSVEVLSSMGDFRDVLHIYACKAEYVLKY